MEAVLERFSQTPTQVIGAGRTDSGVHATGQTVAFDLSWRHGEGALQRALNANLPADIRVREMRTAAPNFHPRFDAHKRAYQYQIVNAPVENPLQRLYSWHVTHPLQVDLMNEAATVLIGEHDFATFGQPPQGDNSVRELFRADWQRLGDRLTFNIEANAFLYRMVRSIVDGLKRVGDGSWTVADFNDAFLKADRSLAAGIAPAKGLCLIGVEYRLP